MRNVAVVVYVVGAALLLSIVGIVVLAVTANPVPDVLQNVAVGSLTGLVGLLVPASSGEHRKG
jgi:hypothetical protein